MKHRSRGGALLTGSMHQRMSSEWQSSIDQRVEGPRRRLSCQESASKGGGWRKGRPHRKTLVTDSQDKAYVGNSAGAAPTLTSAFLPFCYLLVPTEGLPIFRLSPEVVWRHYETDASQESKRAINTCINFRTAAAGKDITVGYVITIQQSLNLSK